MANRRAMSKSISPAQVGRTALGGCGGGGKSAMLAETSNG
jgi:hypothetical protein